MSSQGERLFTVTIGAVLAGIVCFMVVGCVSESNKLDESPQEVRALAACNDQPNIAVRTYAGTEQEPGRYSEEKLVAVERDKYVVEAVSKCRKDVLDYYTGKNTQGNTN